MLELKDRVIKTCNAVLEDKVTQARKTMRELQEASNNETKSSAGDKYETGRAMVQLEKEKVATALESHLKLQRVMSQISSDEKKEIGLGSLVSTDKGYFFISVSLGKLEVPELVFCLSPVSPLGKALIGGKPNKVIHFNNQDILINKIA